MKTPFLLFLYGLTGLNRIIAGGPVPTDTPTQTRPDSLARTQPGSAAPARPDSLTPQPIRPAVQLTGELALSTGFCATRGPETSRARVTPWDLTGNLTLSTRSGWTVPIQLVWSSQNNRYSQPYGQVGVSPRYKNWLTLHGGYRNVVFSPLTLAGHAFLGAGVELNPGLLRVGAVVGQFNRAVNAHHTDPDRVATFRRTGYSAKLGVGNERNYFDLILLRVADNSPSIRSDSRTGPRRKSGAGPERTAATAQKTVRRVRRGRQCLHPRRSGGGYRNQPPFQCPASVPGAISERAQGATIHPGAHGPANVA